MTQRNSPMKRRADKGPPTDRSRSSDIMTDQADNNQNKDKLDTLLYENAIEEH